MTASGTLKAGIGQSILDMSNEAWMLGDVSGEELRVDAEAMKGLIAEGQAVNVDVRKMAPAAVYYAEHGLPLDSPASRSEFNAASRDVEAKKMLKQPAGMLGRAADAMPDGGGRPAPRPPGDGGAGVVPARR